MTERDKLQICYELAFFPPRLNEAWDRIRKGAGSKANELGELLDTALLLHQSLPENGFASQRALTRLAQYQARARAFGMVGFISRLRKLLDRPPLTEREVPGHLVRDIGLPSLAKCGAKSNSPLT
jgi:hypothetical protein